MRQVIAVSSGKGGVGKSTVAVNLACALAQTRPEGGPARCRHLRPQCPHHAGCGRPHARRCSGSGNEQVLVPIETCGIAMVSMGLLIQENQPVVWRGPMLNGIIRQFLYQVGLG